jgi:hypothetical protein
LSDARISLDFLVNLGLKVAHLRRRRTFLRDEHAPNETAVARRQ